MLVTLSRILKDAIKNKYAVGAFNVTNLESVIAVIRGAEAMNTGVILNYAEVHEMFIPIEDMAPIMLHYARSAKVPVCVHLDHGTSLEMCMKAMKLGFTSVMFDASSAEYEINVRETTLICRVAHSVGVSVEAELGHVHTSDIGASEGKNQEDLELLKSNEDMYTDPDLAKDFVERTGVDALAIAFGTVHGIYKEKPILDLDRITDIKNKIDIPFVMHGGSGLSKDGLQGAIKNGIRKINYYTYMSMAGGVAVKEVIKKNLENDNIFFHDISLIGIDAMQHNVINAMKIFRM
ncbi:MAG: ketose-bisphosphate aldolase [Lachnospirales bacterium]